MDSLGLDNSMLIGLQLEHLTKQFTNNCPRLNINTNFVQPIKHWLLENIRGKFTTRNAKIRFRIAKRYGMLWELKMEREDIKFIVNYDKKCLMLLNLTFE